MGEELREDDRRAEGWTTGRRTAVGRRTGGQEGGGQEGGGQNAPPTGGHSSVFRAFDRMFNATISCLGYKCLLSEHIIIIF